jgi:hypothetical protein
VLLGECSDHLGTVELHPAQEPTHSGIAQRLELTDNTVVHPQHPEERRPAEPLHQRANAHYLRAAKHFSGDLLSQCGVVAVT